MPHGTKPSSSSCQPLKNLRLRHETKNSWTKSTPKLFYEGYILYPYRASAKESASFTFGRVYPEAYSVAQNGVEPCMM